MKALRRKKVKNLHISELLSNFAANSCNMKGFEITELIDFSGEKAHIYSVTLNGDGQTLLEQFFEENSEHEEELSIILEKLMVMGHDTGCRREFFKHHEGASADGVAALRVGQMRLYCLYFDRTAVFFGSGAYKPPHIKAYQEDTVLNSKAMQMRDIAARINKAITERDIVIEQDGNITINYWDNEDDE